jgi:hypothetical protein
MDCYPYQGNHPGILFLETFLAVIMESVNHPEVQKYTLISGFYEKVKKYIDKGFFDDIII